MATERLGRIGHFLRAAKEDVTDSYCEFGLVAATYDLLDYLLSLPESPSYPINKIDDRSWRFMRIRKGKGQPPYPI